jgi:hypothetical protein
VQSKSNNGSENNEIIFSTILVKTIKIKNKCKNVTGIAHYFMITLCDTEMYRRLG